MSVCGDHQHVGTSLGLQGTRQNTGKPLCMAEERNTYRLVCPDVFLNCSNLRLHSCFQLLCVTELGI